MQAQELGKPSWKEKLLLVGVALRRTESRWAAAWGCFGTNRPSAYATSISRPRSLESEPDVVSAKINRHSGRCRWLMPLCSKQKDLFLRFLKASL